jgi:hypothetical protein
MDRPHTHVIRATDDDDRSGAVVQYSCWFFLLLLFVLIVVDASMWYPHRQTGGRVGRNDESYGTAAMAIALVYIVFAVVFVWAFSDGIGLVFLCLAVLVFVFAGATVGAVAWAADDAGWVVLLMFCLLIATALIACGHATWSWRARSSEVVRSATDDLPVTKKRRGFSVEPEEVDPLESHLPPLVRLTKPSPY